MRKKKLALDILDIYSWRGFREKKGFIREGEETRERDMRGLKSVEF